MQFVSIVCSVAISLFPEEYGRVPRSWLSDSILSPVDHRYWPTANSRDIFPNGCHSHNDYWHAEPLCLALQAGCVRVEAETFG